MTITYSVVVPLKDEEENVRDLIEELEPVMEGLKAPWELICIDDGSTDKTLTILQNLLKTKPYLRILSFENNCGQSGAFDAGFRAARGEYVITMDGDRQNDPHDIPKLVSIMDKNDLVCGCRAKRKDTWFKRIISRVANKVRGRLCGDGMRDTGCSLKVYRTACFDRIKLFNGMHRFLPALFQIEGFRVDQVDVNHRHRTKGKTKYNLLNRSFNTIADLFAVMWMRKRCLKYRINKELP